MRYVGLITATGMAALACAIQPPPVMIEADAGSAAALTGKWSGDYESGQSGRSGVISFELRGVEDSAFGEVVMFPRPTAGPTHIFAEPVQDRPPLSTEQHPRALRIAFVYAGGGVVTGELEPYLDPDCGCTLLTRFVGEQHGDVIEGTFTSRHSDCGLVVSGRWKVARQREERSPS